MSDVALIGRNPTIWQPTRPLFWAYSLPILYAVAFHLPFVVMPPGGWTVAAVVVWLPPNALLTLVVGWTLRRLDPFEKEPISMLWAGALWGCTAATLAFVPNNAITDLMTATSGTDVTAAWLPAVAGPTTEEWLKGVGILVVMLICRSHIQRPLDGFILGAATGLGFQVIENLTYAYNAAISGPNDDWSQTVAVSVMRVLIGATSHWVYSAVVGFGLAYALTRTTTTRAHRVMVAMVMLLAAWLLHALWNSPLMASLGLAALAIKMVVIGLFVVSLYQIPARQELDWFRGQLSNEPADSITPEELADLASLRSRRRARRRVRATSGRRAVAALAALHEAQLSLAIAIGNHDNPARDAAIAHARAEITAARQRLAAVA